MKGVGGRRPGLKGAGDQKSAGGDESSRDVKSGLDAGKVKNSEASGSPPANAKTPKATQLRRPGGDPDVENFDLRGALPGPLWRERRKNFEASGSAPANANAQNGLGQISTKTT